MGFFHLGSNLRDFRKIRGLSQQGLALRAGPPFSQTYVSRLERGLCPADVAHVEVLAAVLGVSPRRLLQRPRRVRHVGAFPRRDSRLNDEVGVR
jgi:transcriptional regulator with XRE-family HTH domain